MRAAPSSGTPGHDFSPSEKLVLGTEIVRAYARARWWLGRTDLPRTVSVLRAHERSRRARAIDPTIEGMRLGNAVGRTLRHLPFDSRCLMRSLVLTSVLARRDIDATLVIAVRSKPRFAAHAWVEHDGVPLLVPAGPPFRRLLEI